jgi:hypothetical protein
VVLELVLDGVCVGWAGLLDKHLEVVCGWPHRMLVSMCRSRDVSHTRVAHIPVVAIIMAGRGRGPMMVLLAPLVATFDALLGLVSGDIRRCLPVTTRGDLPAS